VLELVRDGPVPLARPVRRPAAVLFADVAGFTRLSEVLCAAGRHGAEELNRLLNRYFGRMTDEVVRYGGSVVRLAGDAVVAVFPAMPEAARCALAMPAATAEFDDVATSAGPVRLTVKIGLAHGTVTGAVFGDPGIRLEYVVSGPAVDRAAAAEHLAAPGEVLVDRDALVPGLLAGERRGTAYVLDGLSIQVDPHPVPQAGAVPEDVSARLAPFLPPPVAARLRAGHTGLVNEHRKVSVAFVALPDGEPAQESIAAAVRVLDRHGGQLLQIDTGDKGTLLVTCFGAPVAHEDDEERAVRCCLELLSGTASRAGLTTAFVFCGAVGSPRRREYLVVGDAVNLAARLMQAAEPGHLLVDDRTHTRVKDIVAARDLPPLLVKGKTEPVVVHAIHGVVEPEGRGGQTGPFVGRDTELARLTAMVARARAGTGQAVAITGEAGAGKSRLAAEVVRVAARHGFAVHRGAAGARDTQTGYLVWRPVWRALLDVGDPPWDDARRTTPHEYVTGLDGGSAQRAPLLAPVLNMPMADTDLTTGLDAATRAELLHTLLADMLRDKAQGPLLLVLEDCHWIDEPSAALLTALARVVTDLPVLLLVTSRDTVDGVGAALALRELPPGDAETLVTARLRDLGTEPSPELTGPIVARAAGNPLFLEELANLVHTGGERTDLPDTLHSLLTARLDQLDEAAQATVKVASVLGRTFPASWVWSVYPALGGADAVRGHLERLTRLDLTTSHGDGRFSFRHGLIQEVAYRTLAFATRAELHESAGAFAERTAPADVETLAYHYGRSDNTGKQRVWFRAAGDAARAAFANDTAIEHYQRLLPLLSKEDQGAVLVHLGALWHLTGQWTDAEQAYDRAIDIGESSGDRRVVAESRRDLGVLCTYRRAYPEAVGRLTAAGAEFDRLGDRRGVASTLDRLSFAHFQQGDYADALAVAERHLALATALGDQNGRSAALENMGLVHGHTSDHELAVELLTRALRVAEEAGNQKAVSYAANDLAGVHLRHGDHVRAMACLEQAREAAQRIGFRSLLAVLIGNAGELYREHGDHTRALGCFVHALTIALDLGDRTSMLGQLGNLGLTAAAQGRTDVADRLLTRAIGLARQLTAPYLLCEFLFWQAKLRADHGGKGAAVLNAEALAIADRIDHRHHRLHCRLLAVRLTCDFTAQARLRALLPDWQAPADQAAIHTELWRLAGVVASREVAVELVRDLLRSAPSEELREQLAILTGEDPPECPVLPPLPPEVTSADLDTALELLVTNPRAASS
jgi:class 3 adenylate cyclase/tetratricopeptide (TPR) repeat protein